MEELPKLYNSRVDYIRPCVSALLESQAKFYDSYSTFYESVLNLNGIDDFENKVTSQDGATSSHESTKSLSVDNIDAEIQKCMHEIKSLSIVAGD